MMTASHNGRDGWTRSAILKVASRLRKERIRPAAVTTTTPTYPLEIQGMSPEKGEERPENVKDNWEEEESSDASVYQEGGMEDAAHSQPSQPR